MVKMKTIELEVRDFSEMNMLELFVRAMELDKEIIDTKTSEFFDEGKCVIQMIEMIDLQKEMESLAKIKNNSK